ncbi:MAG: TadE/TadG family type IV pilus assembly protein [Acidimicrobiia bacterium]
MAAAPQLPTTKPPLSRRRDERGAALVEAAILSPVFFMMIFGLFEFGLAFYDKLTVANMSRAGARAATTVGNDLLADHQLVAAIDKAAGAMSRESIEYVVVYRAASPTSTVPAGNCASGVPSDANDCNVYHPADFAAPETSFGCGPTDLDRFWCPTGREVAASGPPDYVGVFVKATHDNLTGFFGQGYTFTDDTVLRIEARRR